MEEIKMENPVNPWVVAHLEEFLFFCCPECDEKSQSKEYFLEHAIGHHPKAKEVLFKFQVKDEPLEEENGNEDNSYFEADVEINEQYDNSEMDLDYLDYETSTNPKVEVKEEDDYEDDEEYEEKPKKKRKIVKKPKDPSKPKELKEKRDSYQCGSCGVEFVKWADLKNHYRTVHVHKDLSGQCQYHCVACNTMFDTLSKLKYHAKNAHLNKKAHKCKYCDETFTRPLYLNKHVKTVHEDKYLKCDECGKSCNSEASK